MIKYLMFLLCLFVGASFFSSCGFKERIDGAISRQQEVEAIDRGNKGSRNADAVQQPANADSVKVPITDVSVGLGDEAGKPATLSRISKIISWENRYSHEAVDGLVTSSEEDVLNLGSFGFIEYYDPFTNSRKTIFVHKDYLQDRILRIGDEVEFDIDMSTDPKYYGNSMAINVRKVLD